jgi:hypothetical protein
MSASSDLLLKRLHAFEFLNFPAGLWTLTPACLLWINHRCAFAASIATFALHAIVLFLLLILFHGQVAAQSLGAMSFRVMVWIAILTLLMFEARKAG